MADGQEAPGPGPASPKEVDTVVGAASGPSSGAGGSGVTEVVGMLAKTVSAFPHSHPAGSVKLAFG